MQAITQVHEEQVTPQACILHNEDASDLVDEPESKRRRLLVKQERPPEYPEPPARDSSISESSSEKTEEVTLEKWMSDALEAAPRVGKKVIQEGPLFQQASGLFPEVTLRCLELCKGTDRFRKPPIPLMPGEAPCRRSFVIHRNDSNIIDSKDWWVWENKSNRQICQKSPPARLMVSVFGRLKDIPVEDSEDRSKSTKRRDSSLEDLNPNLPKRPFSGIKGVEEPKEIEPKAEDSAPSVPQHGPKFLKLDKEHQQWLMKIHQNLGHPSAQKLKIVLKDQKCPDCVMDAIDDYRCSICHESQRPRHARPSATSNVKDFNDSVGCDGIQWTAKDGSQYYFFHFIDAATNFHSAHHTYQTDALGAFNSFQHAWLHWAGPCEELVVDGASSFCAETFAEHTQGLNVKVRVVAAHAHWQLGKVERHGEILQEMLRKYDTEHEIKSSHEFNIALTHCCNAKNALSRHSGYTPEILVLGKSRKLPGSLSQNAPDAAQYLADSESPEGVLFRNNLAKRECARRAFIAADNDDRLRRAFLRRHRPHRGWWNQGDNVMFWRNGLGQNPGRWHGPATVINHENNSIVWLSHIGRIYRTAPEHIRSLSIREHQEFQEQKTQSNASIPSQIGKGVFQYEDLTQQTLEPSELTIPDPDSMINPQVLENPNQPTVEHMDEHQPNSGGSCDQPDSEPAEIPSSGYSPSHSSGEVPDPNTAIDASTVPIPSDDDELFTDDHWIIQGNQLIRRHVKPRQQEFHPNECDDCPVSLLALLDQRITVGKDNTGIPWTQSDSWIHKTSPPWEHSKPWTGHTIFHIHHEPDTHDSPEPQDILHVSEEQCFAIEIFLTAEDENNILREPIDHWCHVASAVKRQRAEIKLRDLTPEEMKEFREAQGKEISQWLDTGTVRRIARHMIPEQNIMQCRWVHTWKELDAIDAEKLGKNRKAKSRLVILGYQDPNIEDIPRDSPTLHKESRSLLLQLCAARKWTIQSFDVKTAFGGSRRDPRVLGVEPPPEMRDHMKLKSHEVCELLKSAYGLVNAPYLWFVELKETLIKLGMVQSPLDPCLFTLPDSNGSIAGIIGMHVDDGLCAGGPSFHKLLSQLEAKFPFGSHRSTDFTFTGIHINQDKEFNIHLDQTDYVNAINPISIDRDRRKRETMNVTESERQAMRGLVGSLQYAATNTRPDISSRLSFLQSKINCATIRDLHDCNRLLGDAKKYHDVKIKIQSIPEDRIQFVAYSDASFASREKQQSQKGCLMVAADKSISEKRAAKASPLHWYSKKISRVVASTLAAETYALSDAVDSIEWIRLSWAWILNPQIEWRSPEISLKEVTPSLAIVDCKSLYDAITKNTTPQCREHRTLLEALVIKDRAAQGVNMYWVHSAAQLADSLTKHMDNTSLRWFLQNGHCCLHDISEVLKNRADKRAQKQWFQETHQLTPSNNSMSDIHQYCAFNQACFAGCCCCKYQTI